MKVKRRRVRPTAVIACVLFLCVVVLAIIVLLKFLDFKPYFEKDNEEFHENAENVSDAPEQIPENDESAVETDIPDEPEIPTIKETIPVLSDDAPKPVFTQAEFLLNYPGTVLKSTEDAGDEYIDRIYFVGDSTTYGLKHYGILKDGQNTSKVWTPRSGTLAMWNLLTEKIVLSDDDIEVTIPEAASIKKPEIMVMTLGVNGVSLCTKEQFVDYYGDLIDKIKEASPDTVLILQSIYPVCSDYEYVNSISMEKINNANSWIAEIANNKGCYFLNTTSILVDETGYLKSSYSNGDGIHISPEGFSVILNYIRTHDYLG